MSSFAPRCFDNGSHASAVTTLLQGYGVQKRGPSGEVLDPEGSWLRMLAHKRCHPVGAVRSLGPISSLCRLNRTAPPIKQPDVTPSAVSPDCQPVQHIRTEYLKLRTLNERQRLRQPLFTTAPAGQLPAAHALHCTPTSFCALPCSRALPRQLCTLTFTARPVRGSQLHRPAASFLSSQLRAALCLFQRNPPRVALSCLERIPLNCTQRVASLNSGSHEHGHLFPPTRLV